MEYIRIGQVAKPQGVKGEVKVIYLTDNPERFESLKRVYLERNDGRYADFEIEKCSLRADGVYITFKGLYNRDDVESLRMNYVCVKREDAVELPEDHYFICDLIGCKIFDSEGLEIGTVKDILQHGAADVYVVTSKNGNEILFPALKKLITDTNIVEKRIIVDKKVFQEVTLTDED